MITKSIKAICASALLIICAACSQKTVYNTDDIFAMDTFVTIVYQNDSSYNVKDVCENELDRIELIFSKTISDSETYKINENMQFTVSKEFADVVSRSIEIANTTNGAFNPAMGQIVSLWDVTGKKYIPTDDEIASLLPYCSFEDFSVNGNTITKKHIETKLDLGACVKGYAAQHIIEKLKENGVENAMISIGGNIAVTGQAQGREKVWRVGIRNPFSPDEIAGYIDCTDTVISVSGDYERYFENDGIIYHHIFDSATGKPSDTDIKSVAVIADDGLLSDALSTALFCMGSADAISFYNSGIYDFEAVIFQKNGNVVLTDGMENRFTLFDDSGLFIK